MVAEVVFEKNWNLLKKNKVNVSAADMFVRQMALYHGEFTFKRHFSYKEEVGGRGVIAAESAMLSFLHRTGSNLLSLRTLQAVNQSYYSAQMAKRVAVVLAGCGVYDGSEIHEASAVLVHLSRGGARVSLAHRCC